MATKTVQPIREHAQQLLTEIAQQQAANTTTPSVPNAPFFSKGTSDRPDEEFSLQPGAPSFSEQTVSLPDGTETTGTATGQTALDSKPEDQQRDAQGRFIGTPQEQGSTPAAQPQATPGQEAGAKAAEQAAAQVVDAFGEFDQLDLDEPDFPDIKIPVRVPKQYAQIMKRAFPRRADYDRIRQGWGDARDVLEPLLKDGRFRQILPLIQYAMNNQSYGDYVWNGYQRAQSGQPLIEQALREAANASPASPPMPPPQAPQMEGFTDPLIEQAIQPLHAQVQSLQTQLAQQAQREEQARSAQAQFIAQQQQQANDMLMAHRDLEQMFPDAFKVSNGPTDPAWQEALRTAQAYGFIERYGLKAGIIFGGQRWREMEQDRLAATASPAAQVLQEIDQKALRLARQQAADAAQTVTGGTIAQSPAPPQLTPPSTRNPDGSMKDPEQFARENMAYLRARGAA